MEQKQTEIKVKIAELQKRFAILKAQCSFGARVSRETIENYAREIEALQTQLN